MDGTLTMYKVMDLADNIITETVHSDRLLQFCEKSKITKIVSDGESLGERWYKNFMKRHYKKIECKPGRLQVGNHLTWGALLKTSRICTIEFTKQMLKQVLQSNIKRKSC
jgi:hypothetical protein